LFSSSKQTTQWILHRVVCKTLFIENTTQGLVFETIKAFLITITSSHCKHINKYFQTYRKAYLSNQVENDFIT